MRLSLLPLVAALAAPAAPASAQPADPAGTCEAAALAAEQAYALPPGLLGAIGRVESGRWDGAGGRLRAWPWALNVEGAGAFAPDAESAAAAVAAAQARGRRSIDVGCFQVNLLHHPHAFATIAEGFLPAANADYAARLLRTLHDRTGSWPQAAAAYHSAVPEVGGPYWAKVASAWAEAPGAGRAGGATLPAAALPASVSGVQVWTPQQPGTAPSWIQLGTPSLPAVTTVARNDLKFDTR